MSDAGGGWGLRVRVWVERGGRKVLGPGRAELIEHIDRLHSIGAAAKAMGMSYRRAWELVRDTNEAAGVPLVAVTAGGAGGGGATVTPHGRAAVRLYRSLIARFDRAAADAPLPADPLAGPPHPG
jgi:molybdate transport system regulatory protein